MMLPDLLNENLVEGDLPSDRWGAISALLSLIQGQEDFGPDQQAEIMAALRAREQQVSTGVGFGLAIPHAFVRGITSPKVSLGRCRAGIEFDAVDARPVNVVLLLLVPEGDYRQHIATLSSVAKCFADKDIFSRLMEADSAAKILQTIRQRFRTGECCGEPGPEGAGGSCNGGSGGLH